VRVARQLEGVAERVDLHAADMRQLPLGGGAFDVVVSSLAIHNVRRRTHAGTARSGQGAQEKR
jgi:ubiquinone/menaquinone biosynthesis C-methylase UbiE